MQTTFFQNMPNWSKYYFITPGPLRNNTDNNHISIDLQTEKIIGNGKNRNGKLYTFFMEYENSKIIYGGRPADAVGKSILLHVESGSLEDFFDKLKKLDDEVAVYWFIQNLIGQNILRFF